MIVQAHRMRSPTMGHDSYWLRKLAYLGARYGSTQFVRSGPVAIGALFSGILPKYRKAIRANLRRIYGPRSIWQENRDVTKTFVAYACCLTESLGFERMNPKDVMYKLVGRTVLDSLTAQTAGFIVATAHVGAWDSAAVHLHQVTGREVLVVMTRESDPAARTFHDSIRQRKGVEIAHVGQNAFEGLRLLKHLRNGGIIAVQLDRLPESSRSLRVLLFEQDFEIPRGPFQLASLASVPIVPVFSARTGHFEYEIHINSPIGIERRASVSQLVEAAQAAISDLEIFLRRYPTQWFHFNIDSTVSVT